MSLRFSPGQPAEGQAPTLEMVAHLAGVSRATVSRVVNGSPLVTAAVVETVNRAIAELNYVPNRAARSLASRKTNVVALIVPESTSTVFNDPFFASIIQGIARYLNTTDYTLNLLLESEASAAKTRRYLVSGNVDGALVVSHHSGDDSYTKLERAIPMVFGGRPVPASESAVAVGMGSADGVTGAAGAAGAAGSVATTGSDVAGSDVAGPDVAGPDSGSSYFVDVDNVASARLATAHLIGLGRKRIATIGGRPDMPAGIDRLYGWRDELAGAGLDTSLVELGDFGVESGAAAMRRLLDRDPNLDAVFVANDQMAVGAYSVLREAGKSIPTDVAVVGFDDDLYASAVEPGLTTIHQPSSELGAKMAETLLQLLSGGTPPRATIMPTSLILRGSA